MDQINIPFSSTRDYIEYLLDIVASHDCKLDEDNGCECIALIRVVRKLLK